jgi:hypothetical protein
MYFSLLTQLLNYKGLIIALICKHIIKISKIHDFRPFYNKVELSSRLGLSSLQACGGIVWSIHFIHNKFSDIIWPWQW